MALELLRRFVEKRTETDILKVAVLGCSAGAEAYSVAWRIRSARPDLRLILQAVDVSQQAIEVARCGIYSLGLSQTTRTDIFDHMTRSEIVRLFDREGDVLTIKPWIKEGIEWHVGDVRDPEILNVLGLQDIVVANNFLCHMNAPEAEKCLHNISRLVNKNGYLFVSGIDLYVKMRVATDLGWTPIEELLEEIHDGDPRMAVEWPWSYSSLEPFSKKEQDWRFRYAQAFRVSGADRTTDTLAGRSNAPEGVRARHIDTSIAPSAISSIGAGN
jgi:hypothetical protein